MTESTATYSWDTVDADETLTEADQAASNDLSISTPVGVFTGS